MRSKLRGKTGQHRQHVRGCLRQGHRLVYVRAFDLAPELIDQLQEEFNNKSILIAFQSRPEQPQTRVLSKLDPHRHWEGLARKDIGPS